MQAHVGTLLGRSAEVVTGSEFAATQRAAQSLARSPDRLFASRVRQGTLRLGDESGGAGVGAASPAASGGGLALDALSTLALQRFLNEKKVIDHIESALLERATDKLAARLEQIVV